MACCESECTEGGVVAGRDEKWTYAGAGQGAYETVSEVVYVGAGKGSIDKRQTYVTQRGNGCSWVVCALILLVLFVGLLVIFFHPQSPGFDDGVEVPVPVYDTVTHEPTEIIIRHHILHKTLYKHVKEEVHGAPHVIVDHVYAPHRSYSCSEGSQDWRGWSSSHKRWCCWKENFACPVKVVTKDKYVHVTQNHSYAVPKGYKVPVPAMPPPPVVVHVKVPAPALPPRLVKVPFKVPGERPPPVIRYKYLPKPTRVNYTKVVWDKKEVEVPVTVKKYVREEVPEKPEIIQRTRTVYVPEKGHDCIKGYHDWKTLWDQDHQRYCCWKAGRACPPTKYKTILKAGEKVKYVDVPVPTEPKVVVRKHTVNEYHDSTHFDCSEGFKNWYFGWSPVKKRWCCKQESRGCPGSWHGAMHIHLVHHTVIKGGGQAKGKIYDCNAGFSNWLHGWSDSKKSWCCEKTHRGCVKFHCFHGEATTWSSEKSDWCCSTFQRGCPHTTLSKMGCQTPCVIHGESSVCMERIKWTSKHVFGSSSNACALAYSKIQVECDVCRACSIEEAGCTVAEVETSAAFDCNAALANFFRAWSPPKKQWCCTNEGRGCEGANPPSVDPGLGMKWKHVQVSGYWTWMAVKAGGTVVNTPVQHPYDCHAGLANWQSGWSQPKKVWCCSNKHMGCGASGAAAGGAGAPPSAAAAGMVWKWQNDGGQWHWIQIHFSGHMPFDCRAGLAKFKQGWSAPKKNWCCHQQGLGCA